jgi:hypothetical protein
MTRSGTSPWWAVGFTVAGAVVAIVAALLLAIIATARSILANAERIIGVANEIVENTRPIWQLERTNAVAVELLDGARAIEEHGLAIADALESGAGDGPSVDEEGEEA